MTKKAYLQFGGAALGAPHGPFQTVEVELRETETPRSGQTLTGYGAKLPSPYMVRYEGRWRRVYVANWGNAGTAYIGRPGAWEATVDIR
jgi:hypothetical protein